MVLVYNCTATYCLSTDRSGITVRNGPIVDTGFFTLGDVNNRTTREIAKCIRELKSLGWLICRKH